MFRPYDENYRLTLFVPSPTQNYDGLNRPTMCENTQAGDVVFGRSWYQYDKAGREVATWRDEESGKGERYSYSATNQLTSARYGADQAWTRTVDYVYAPDGLNRSLVFDNGVVTTYGYTGMNQYTWLNGWGPGIRSELQPVHSRRMAL
jgi:hypothetical protein